MAATYYTVTARAKHPAWDEHDGITYREVFAKSKADAIKTVRRRHVNNGHVGVWYFTATGTEDESQD